MPTGSSDSGRASARGETESEGSRWIWALVLAAVALAYARAGGLSLTWDDDLLIEHNEHLHTLAGLGRMWAQDTFKASGLGEAASYYRPVPMTTFWLTAQLTNSAAAHHLVNVALHVLNVAIVGRVLVRRIEAAPTTAAALAGLWGLAVANSEAVLWIAGRFDLLLATCALGSLLANAGRKTVVTGLWLAGALLSKEAAVAWVVVLMLDDWLLLERPAPERRRRAAAWAALVVAYLLLRRLVGIETSIPWAEVISSAPASFVVVTWRAVSRFLVPAGLDPFQPLAVPPLPVVVLAVVAALAIVIALARAARLGAPHHASARRALLGVACLLLVLAPTIAIPAHEHVTGDRYGYLANVGLLFLMAAVARTWTHGRSRRLLVGGVTLVALAQAVLLQPRIPEWHDRASIAQASYTAHPDNHYACYLVGLEAFERGDFVTAETYVQRSLALHPTWRALNASCVLLLRRGRLPEAERDCLASAKIHPSNPRVWVNLSSIAHRAHAWDLALTRARIAIDVKPRYAEAHYLAAVAALNLQRLDDAAAHCRDGLAADPSHEELQRLASVLEERFGKPVP